ncbi:hypothetical protein, partial [Chromobacterium haemolyticum]|uniref:hypothetical protein n=1 Tax=Chromobacterium haemolyticum TaxID=394935 RepID=UPI0019660288
MSLSRCACALLFACLGLSVRGVVLFLERLLCGHYAIRQGREGKLGMKAAKSPGGPGLGGGEGLERVFNALFYRSRRRAADRKQAFRACSRSREQERDKAKTSEKAECT